MDKCTKFTKSKIFISWLVFTVIGITYLILNYYFYTDWDKFNLKAEYIFDHFSILLNFLGAMVVLYSLALAHYRSELAIMQYNLSQKKDDFTLFLSHREYFFEIVDRINNDLEKNNSIDFEKSYVDRVKCYNLLYSENSLSQFKKLFPKSLDSLIKEEVDYLKYTNNKFKIKTGDDQEFEKIKDDLEMFFCKLEGLIFDYGIRMTPKSMDLKSILLAVEEGVKVLYHLETISAENFRDLIIQISISKQSLKRLNLI